MDSKNNVLDINKAGIKPIAKDEIFVQVRNTFNYWVSNYGRVVNNLKGKDVFYMYKTGDVHLTLTNHYIDSIRVPYDTKIRDLVAEHFLFKIKGKDRVYQIDGNKENNYYKNLVYIDSQEQYELRTGAESISTFQNRQEYVDYGNNSKISDRARAAYRMIYMRTHDKEVQKRYPQYAGATMYKGWEKEPELFYEWYEHNNYKCNGEQMVVDKDLFKKGNKMYAPDVCCLLPWTLNVMLSNSKKSYNARYDRIHTTLPYGVKYDKGREKYYSEIRMDKALSDGGEYVTRTRYRDTPEEAFADYKKHKEAYIIMMADKYRAWLPLRVYDALVDYVVEPY